LNLSKANCRNGAISQALRRPDDHRIASFVVDVTTACPAFESIEQMDAIRWELPPTIAPGRYRIRAVFCENPYPEMPKEVLTPEFEISAGQP
jgi:hypothetical protein